MTPKSGNDIAHSPQEKQQNHPKKYISIYPAACAKHDFCSRATKAHGLWQHFANVDIRNERLHDLDQ